MSSAQVFPESGNRFAEVSPDDHRGYVWVAALLSLVYAFLVLGVRAILKHRRYSLDDAVLVVGYVRFLPERSGTESVP
jgi:hypothetical protein